MSCHQQLQYKRITSEQEWNSPVRHLVRQQCFQIWQDEADKHTPRSPSFSRGYLEYYDAEMHLAGSGTKYWEKKNMRTGPGQILVHDIPV